MNKSKHCIWTLLLIANIFITIKPESKKNSDIKVTNMTKAPIWAARDDQTIEKSYMKYTKSGKKIITYTVGNFIKINPNQTVSFQATTAIEPTDTGLMETYSQIKFLRPTKPKPYIITAKDLEAILYYYITPLTKKYGNIWMSSETGYTSLYNPPKMQTIKASPYKKTFAREHKDLKWVEITIPTFETFDVRVPNNKSYIKYFGWKKTKIG